MCLTIAFNYRILYNTIRDAILTCDQKPTWVRLIYSMEPTTKKLRTENYKQICSEVSVNSPRNPWNQFRGRKGRLCWEGFAKKGRFKPGMKEWRGDWWWVWCVDGTDGESATQRTGWVRVGEISALLAVRRREFIPEARGSIREGMICYL